MRVERYHRKGTGQLLEVYVCQMHWTLPDFIGSQLPTKDLENNGVKGLRCVLDLELQRTVQLVKMLSVG